jgi:hypothetical protein
MKKNILLVVTLVSFFMVHTCLLAQSTGAEKKLNNLISTLDDTKFIKDYKSYKSEMEGLVAEIKLSEGEAKDVAKAKLSYNQSKMRFDGVLDQLKRDLANTGTRKLIMKSPESFSRNYQKRLDEAKLYCNDNFAKKASAILKTDALDLSNIELLLGTFFTIFKSFSEKKGTDNEFSAQFLELNLIEPLRFKAWDKVE